MSDEETYQPKHMKVYHSYTSHCCFAGCTPMGCPGRCCVNEFGHRLDCPTNPIHALDDAEHDVYVDNGLRKHLAKPEDPYYVPSLDWGALPPLRGSHDHVG
jgi:hypothetical protein